MLPKWSEPAHGAQELTGVTGGIAGELLRPRELLDNLARWSLDKSRGENVLLKTSIALVLQDQLLAFFLWILRIKF